MKGEISSRKEHVETSHDGSKGNSDFITVECLLAFDTDEDKKKVLDLMRKFSSMVRFAYKRLLKKTEEKDLRKLLPIKYGLNARYSNAAIFLAQQALVSCLERKQNPKKLILGSRALFEHLKKKHLAGTKREKLRQKWEERRYDFVYATGEKEAKGNLNLLN